MIGMENAVSTSKKIPKDPKTMKTKLALLSFLILLIPSLSHAKDVTFQWTANPEPVVGYKLHYKTGDSNTPPYDGTGLTEGNSPIPIGKVTTYTVTGLSDSETYHFTITAYNDTEESEYSTIVTVRPDSSLSPIILNIRKIE